MSEDRAQEREDWKRYVEQQRIAYDEAQHPKQMIAGLKRALGTESMSFRGELEMSAAIQLINCQIELARRMPTLEYLAFCCEQGLDPTLVLDPKTFDPEDNS